MDESENAFYPSHGVSCWYVSSLTWINLVHYGFKAETQAHFPELTTSINYLLRTIVIKFRYGAAKSKRTTKV